MATRRTKKKSDQLELGLPVRSTWGGARKGAGRKKTLEGPDRVPHRPRPPVLSRYPVRVTLRLEPGLPDARREDLFRTVQGAVRAASERFGFRVVHYSVQSNELHLLVEAKGRDALAQGVKGLKVRMAHALNRTLDRKGRVFIDRYDAQVLKTPQEVRDALAYVLLNARKHAADAGTQLPSTWMDPFSSGRWFDGWTKSSAPSANHDENQEDEREVSQARTSLLAEGWRECGLIDLAEVPTEAPKPSQE